MKLRHISVLTAGLILTAHAAFGQPTKPTRMLIGFPPGGNVDILARVYGERISETLGRPVIVESRPGATGQIAAEMVKAAAPDGYTLLLTPESSLVLRPLVTKKPAYDPLTDFSPIAHTGLSAQALAVGIDVPAKDLREFANWIKANPNRGSVALPGLGGSMHFFAVMVGQELGVKLQIIPYKGSGPSVTDVAAGHVPATVNPLGTMLAQAKAGKLRVIGVSGTHRAPVVPDVPTFAEQGFGNLNVHSWFGIFGPAGIPQELVNRLNGAIVQAMRQPAIRERMQSLDLEILELTPAQMSALVKRDYERWIPIIRASGFTAED